jgi:GAF domain-containing protein
VTGPEARLNTEELALLYRVAETLLGEREYGELLASLLDAAIEGLAAGRGDRAGGLE